METHPGSVARIPVQITLSYLYDRTHRYRPLHSNLPTYPYLMSSKQSCWEIYRKYVLVAFLPKLEVDLPHQGDVST